MGDDIVSTIVLDCGSSSIKAGFAGEYTPRAEFPSIIGRSSSEPNDFYIGKHMQSKRDILNLKYPISRGVVKNWDDMEMFLNYTFNEELMILTEESAVLLTEVPLNPKINREKTTQIMFETFNSPAMFISLQPVMAMYASGRTSGTVLDFGDGVTSVVPVSDGYVFTHAVIKTDYSGCDLTNSLDKRLRDRGVVFSTPSEKETLRSIKEKLCYIAYDFEKELANFGTADDQRSFQLPDGTSIVLENERFVCPEAMFQPHLFGLEFTGIHESIYNAILKCDIELRKELYTCIVLAGGSSLLKGIDERLTKELSVLTPSYYSFKVVSSSDRRLSGWIGGSILAGLSTFQQMWITKFDYDESGPCIVHRKCF